MKCPGCGASLAEDAQGCGVCFTSVSPEVLAEQTAGLELLASLPVTTTSSFEPAWSITHWHGPVFGEAILGANVFSDVAAGVRDVVGGRSASYERQLARGREIALVELRRAAIGLGATAVVGARLDYETIKGSMLMVTAQGTAVTIE